jgi:hypothetical protein
MVRFRVFTGMAIMGIAFLVGTGASQDTKTTKAYLPPGWKALGLSKEQSLDISKIHSTYKAKIKALEDQIKDEKTKEKQEMVKILRACKTFCVSAFGSGYCISVSGAAWEPILEEDRKMVQRRFPALDRHRPTLRGLVDGHVNQLDG